MKKYKAIATVTIPAGTVIGLNEHQAKARKHILKEIESGHYHALENLTFKTGEEILLTGIAKGETRLIEIDAPAPVTAKRTKAA